MGQIAKSRDWKQEEQGTDRESQMQYNNAQNNRKQSSDKGCLAAM